MKHILIFIIKIYQKIPGNFHNYCRHTPTCSSYAIEALERYGAIKGSKLAFKRIINCRPHGTFGYDPVPTEGGK